MSKRKSPDLDDDFDEESVFEDDDYMVERIERRREHRGPMKPPKGSREGGSSRESHRSNRRRDLASIKAWGTPY